MSEHEKYEQVGRLAEEVSKLRGELNQISEKLQRAYLAYSRMQQSGNIQVWNVADGHLTIPPNANFGNQVFDPGALLNEHQLVEILERRQKLTHELNTATERLRGLAPHLV